MPSILLSNSYSKHRCYCSTRIPSPPTWSKYHVAMHAAVDGSTIPDSNCSPLPISPSIQPPAISTCCAPPVLLLVLIRQIGFIFASPLDPSIYLQPEGITFPRW